MCIHCLQPLTISLLGYKVLLRKSFSGKIKCQKRKGVLTQQYDELYLCLQLFSNVVPKFMYTYKVTEWHYHKHLTTNKIRLQSFL